MSQLQENLIGNPNTWFRLNKVKRSGFGLSQPTHSIIGPMNSHPYLDKLVTSPHIPRQDGQTGYCSRKLIPDLSCSGIHSELEKKTESATAADGRMTKTFVMNAHRTMRELQRGITQQNAQEEIFKVGHRQYIDQLLVDMESTKNDKHERRMRHWRKNKGSMGFHDSFECDFGKSSSKRQQLPESTPKSDFSANGSRGASPMDFADEPPVEDDIQKTKSNSSKALTRVRIMESNNTGDVISRQETPESRLLHSAASANSLKSAHSIHSTNSIHSANSQSHSHGANKPDGSSKAIKTHSRLALFNSLLEAVEPPRSPKKRFGSICITNDGVSTTGIKTGSVNFADTWGSSTKSKN